MLLMNCSDFFRTILRPDFPARPYGDVTSRDTAIAT